MTKIVQTARKLHLIKLMYNIKPLLKLFFLGVAAWQSFVNPVWAELAPKKLIFAIDGLSYSAFQAARKQGLFDKFSHSGKHIAPYPSMTEPSWTEIWGGKKLFELQANVKSIESSYFDPDSSTLKEDPRNLFLRYASPYSYVKAFDYFYSPYLEGLMYFPNDQITQMEMKELETEIYDKFTGDHFTAYVSSVDAIGHTQIEGLFPLLKQLSQLIDKIEVHYANRGIPLEMWLVSDHGNFGNFKEGEKENYLTPISLSKAAQQSGLEIVKDKLLQADQIAMPVMALGSFQSVYFKDLSRRKGFALQALQNDAVELATYLEIGPHGQRWIEVLGPELTSARIYWRGDKYAYKKIRGNPLRIPKTLSSHGAQLRWFSDPVFFKNTWDAHFPDSLFRIVQSANKQVENTPDLILSLKDGYCLDGDFSKYVQMVRTHGSLTAGSSLGVIASTSVPLPQAARSEDLIGLMGLTPEAVFHKARDFFQSTTPSSSLITSLKDLPLNLATEISNLSPELIFLRITKIVSSTFEFLTPRDFSDILSAFQKGLPQNWNPPRPEEGVQVKDLLSQIDFSQGLQQLPLHIFNRFGMGETAQSKLPIGATDLALYQGYADLARRFVMKLYTLPFTLNDILNIPEFDWVKDPRDRSFALSWHGDKRHEVLNNPDLLHQDQELSEDLFRAVFEERKLLHRLSPASFPLFYNPKPQPITVVFVPGIYNELFDTEIFSRGLRGLRESLGLRVLYADLDGRCSTEINSVQLIALLKEDTQKRLSRGYERPRYLILGYSKGGIDSTEALLLDQDFTRRQIVGLVSIASPHGGTSIIATSDLPPEVTQKAVLRPLPSECMAQPAAASVLPATRSGFWAKNADQLTGLTRFYSISFQSKLENSHPWMKIAKLLGRFQVPNDGVVTVENSKFPAALHAVDWGTIEADHLAGILASPFPQSAFLEAILISLLETHSFENETTRSWHQIISSESPALRNGFHKREFLRRVLDYSKSDPRYSHVFSGFKKLRTNPHTLAQGEIKTKPEEGSVGCPKGDPEGDPKGDTKGDTKGGDPKGEQVAWYDTLAELNHLLSHPLDCSSLEWGEWGTQLSESIVKALHKSEYAVKPFRVHCGPDHPLTLRIQKYTPGLFNFWNTPQIQDYPIKTLDDWVSHLLADGLQSETPLWVPSNLPKPDHPTYRDIFEIPKSERKRLALPKSSFQWREDYVLNVRETQHLLDTLEVTALTLASTPELNIVFDHKSVKDFREEYSFVYESTSPGGIDDQLDGYYPVLDTLDQKEQTVCRMRSVQNSIRLTTMAFRFRVEDYPLLDLKLKITQDLPGANPHKGGSGKDDSAFEVWFALKTPKNEVKLFGYYWGDTNEEGLLKSGDLIENYYSNKTYAYIVTLPEAWQVFMDGGPASLQEWHHHKHDLAQDLHRAFPQEASIEEWQVLAITLQTDSRDVKGRSEAFFKELNFTPRK